MVSGPKFEPGTSRIGIKSVNHSTTTFDTTATSNGNENDTNVAFLLYSEFRSAILAFTRRKIMCGHGDQPSIQHR
jgi:hypothetical protein